MLGIVHGQEIELTGVVTIDRAMVVTHVMMI